ncbi:MAG TPA: septum formation protein Maf [Aliiroseovarius sp.]|nr:septum formation protein Maf [Aliiroseovarius sp.]
MTKEFILASGSEIRLRLLENAGLSPTVKVARIDEDPIRRSLEAEGVSPRDIADALAEGKAHKVATQKPGAFVLGCDQIAAIGSEILSKPLTKDHAIAQLSRLSGRTHHLYSAAVLYEHGRPVWRFVGKVSLDVHEISEAYKESYVARNWESIRHSVGAYKLEEEGVRLFSAIRGDYFHVLGLPLVELLSYLSERGVLER